MAAITAIAGELDTRAYVWGGWSFDLLTGRFLREHSDIDYLVVDLRHLADRFGARLSRGGWQVRPALDDCLLSAQRLGQGLLDSPCDVC
jgi:hypothetical protein